MKAIRTGSKKLMTSFFFTNLKMGKMNRFRNIALVVLCMMFVVVKGEDSVRIAMLDFENNTGNEEVSHYSQGLRSIIASDLFELLPEITFVERAKIAEVQKELDLGQSKFVDQNTAASMGKLLGANYLLTGSYFCHEDNWRIDVRLIRVETAEIYYTEKKDGTKDSFFDMEKSLVSAIAMNMLPSISQKGQNNFKKRLESGDASLLLTKDSFTSFDRWSQALSKRAKGDEDAWRQFLMEIEVDDPVFLGKMYYSGSDEIKQNYNKAFELYIWGLYREDVSALNWVGICYAKGQGVPKNNQEAVKWFREAVKQGDYRGYALLGFCYYDGEGVAKNPAEAVNCFKIAAEHGVPVALTMLYSCYEEGIGVTRNLPEAMKYLKKGAQQGEAGAQALLANVYMSGNEVVSPNFSEAMKWAEKSAKQGFWPGQYILGMCFFKDNNPSEAVKWLRISAESSYPEAQRNLGACYYLGQGVDKNFPKAVKWFKKAAEQGDAEAQCYLGACYANGEGVARNLLEAVKWLRKSAEQGNQQAQNALKALHQ